MCLGRSLTLSAGRRRDVMGMSLMGGQELLCLGLCRLIVAAVLAMPAVSTVHPGHQEVHQRAGEEQQKRQEPHEKGRIRDGKDSDNQNSHQNQTFFCHNL